MKFSLLLAIGALLAPLESNACRCAYKSVDDAYEDAARVFVATIVSASLDADDITRASTKVERVKVKASLLVEEVLKGDPTNIKGLTLEMYLPGLNSNETFVNSCDLEPFRPGDRWIVVSSSRAWVRVDGCSDTQLLDKNNREYLDRLRELSKDAKAKR